MIEEYQKFRVPDQSARQNNLLFEVNWKPKDKETNQCKILKVTYPDDQKAYIKKEHLFSILFALGSKNEQRKMIPQKVKEVRHYDTDLYLQLRQDAKAGDVIKVPVHLSLPSVEEEVIGELKKDKSINKKVEEITKGGIISPKSVSNPAGTSNTEFKKVDKASKQKIE